MGCDVYEIDDASIRFSDGSEFKDDFWGNFVWKCLCTFPANWRGETEKDTVASMALLGAAVVLSHHGMIESPVYLPDSIPKEVLDLIEKAIYGDKGRPKT